MNKPELLAPAGNFEKMKMALAYGADAVYLSGKRFGLRSGADNFDQHELEQAVGYAHNKGKRIYVTLNIIPHNDDLPGLEDYIDNLKNIGVDAVIVSDPGVLTTVRDRAPNLELHLSTQANCTNWRSCLFWKDHGVKRIILARELSLTEIGEISAKVPDDLHLEAFVHGAMCISYSGRCLLSNYMTYRDSNRGQCAHPCRWKYYIMEQKRPGEYYPVYEDERGTHIFNSKDLCMIQHIPLMIKAGITSFKIEGRMKSGYYVATVVKAYRHAIDEYFKNPDRYEFNDYWLEEIKKVSHRHFTTGFYFDKPGPFDQGYESSKYVRDYEFIGLVLKGNDSNGLVTIEQRNRFFVGDTIEVMGKSGRHFTQRIASMWDSEGRPITSAPHPQQIVKLVLDRPVEPLDIIRKEK
ncbi:MAG: peptidase U32 family protein [Mahellales bacterium]|jgi:putative protease